MLWLGVPSRASAAVPTPPLASLVSLPSVSSTSLSECESVSVSPLSMLGCRDASEKYSGVLGDSALAASFGSSRTDLKAPGFLAFPTRRSVDVGLDCAGSRVELFEAAFINAERDCEGEFVFCIFEGWFSSSSSSARRLPLGRGSGGSF